LISVREKTVLRRAPLPRLLLFVTLALSLLPAAAGAQQKAKPNAGKASANAPASPVQAPQLKRATTRHEVRRFGYGGMVTIYGAPQGSITVEAWQKSEVEITADIELSADTEDELARLAAVNNFLLDEDVNHLRIITTGTHDRAYMKRVARDFPKKLLAMPWKIDYRVRVPAAIDLEISAGRGALVLTGVEGAIRLNAGESAATFTLAGGDVEATIERGPVTLRVPTRNWRGRGLSLRLASGDLNVELPAGFSGDIDAKMLRTGRIENTHAGVAPRERTQTTDHSLQARAGEGGPTLSFTVGDGTLRIVQINGKP
jgi:hypothetical protein